ncbi:MAG: MFS transporter [Actinobacteria bacterium]|nr:MFS transporter [Actinomycetota bacterium]MCB9413475.1 MFS transporter [Actinomycetota bacterium]
MTEVSAASGGADTARVQVPGKAWAILWAMGFGALIAQMFSTVIGPALPTIQEDLGLSLSMTTWTITAYSLAFGTALVAGGRMGDLVGEVRMIVIGFLVFLVGLLLAAIATGGLMLVASRGLQGIGIGISAPATLSIVVNSFPVARRGFAVGVWGFAHGFGLMIGPFFASFMLTYLSWRWVFWLAIPLTVLVIFVTIAATRGYQSVIAAGSYDWIGLILGGLGITLVTYGLQNAPNGWDAAPTWGTLAVGGLLLIAFAVVETRITHPLVDFSLWKERLFSGGFFAESAVGFVYIPMLTFVGSLYFIGVLGFSPMKASVVILLTTATCMVFEPPAGRWVDKIGPGIPITVSLIMQAGALFWMGTFTSATTLAQMVAPLMIMGAGVGIALPACNTAGMSAVDAQRAGMGSGLMQMTFNIPAALGVAVVTSIIGTIAGGKVMATITDPAYQQLAVDFAAADQAGDTATKESILADLPADIAAAVQQATIDAEGSAIAFAMVILGAVALAGAIFAWVVIGRRRTPDHIQMTHAAEL